MNKFVDFENLLEIEFCLRISWKKNRGFSRLKKNLQKLKTFKDKFLKF